MNTVTVDRSEFVAVLQKNRDEHRATFEAAVSGYHRRLVHELERRVHDLRRGRSIDVAIRMPEPEDHTDDYDRVLTMARMSTEDTVRLSEDDFGRYVMDQWRWKQDFITTTGRYL